MKRLIVLLVIFATAALHVHAQQWQPLLPEHLEAMADTSFMLGEQPLADVNGTMRDFAQWEKAEVDHLKTMVNDDLTLDVIILAPADPTLWLHPDPRVSVYMNLIAALLRGEKIRAELIKQGVDPSRIKIIANPFSPDRIVRVYIMSNKRIADLMAYFDQKMRELEDQVKALGFRVDKHDGRISALEARQPSSTHPISFQVGFSAWGSQGRDPFYTPELGLQYDILSKSAVYDTTGKPLQKRYASLRLSGGANPIRTRHDSMDVNQWYTALALDIPVSRKIDIGMSWNFSGELTKRFTNIQLSTGPGVLVSYTHKNVVIRPEIIFLQHASLLQGQLQVSDWKSSVKVNLSINL